MREREPVLREAIEAAGGPAAFAKAAGVKLPSIYSWKRIPAERVVRVEAATGIPRHRLRPDVFPDPFSDPAKSAA